jgi:hypothetical protein
MAMAKLGHWGKTQLCQSFFGSAYLLLTQIRKLLGVAWP